MLDEGFLSRLRKQRVRDEVRAVRRTTALHVLRVQAALKVKDPDEVRIALTLLNDSRPTLEPHELKLANRAEVWIGKHA